MKIGTLVALLAMLVCSPSLAGTTAAQYNNDNGSKSPGSVIMTSPDGVNSQAVSSATPLPTARGKALSLAELGKQTLTPTVSTSLTVPAGATSMILVSEGAAIRFWADGTAPTSAVGFPVPANTPMEFRGTLSNFRMIQQASAATVTIIYY